MIFSWRTLLLFDNQIGQIQPLTKTYITANQVNYSRIGISTVFQEIVICNGMFASHVMETDVKVGKGSYHRLF